MAALADAEAELAAPAEVGDLREALAHALAVAAHEQRLREQAQDTAARAWRVTTTWPRRADRPGAR